MAASKTLRDPSTLIARLPEPAPMIAKARWTTTSAPFTASRTLFLSWTSPWRYSVLRQPSLFGSNGRRAMPMIFFTRRERSTACTSAIPRSPVGPVTATVSPSAGTGAVIPECGESATLASPRHVHDRRVLAALQLVESVRLHGVDAGPAVHEVAPAVGNVDRVVACAGEDPVASAAAGDRVVAAARDDAVVAGAAVDAEAAGAGRDDRVV